MSDFDVRFAGIARLYGKPGLSRLRGSSVLVVGLGGVGTWVAEALARSGIGHLRLVDLDEICVSNINRQLPALDGWVGRLKVEAMAERIQRINPECVVEAVADFFTETTASRLLGIQPDQTPGGPVFSEGFRRPECVVDAIDAVANKCRLLAACHTATIPCISCGGAGGRRDPTQVRLGDLQEVTHDRLLREVRKRLRQNYGLPRGERKMGIPCVFSRETPIFPDEPEKSGTHSAPVNPGVEGPRLNCDWGYGSVTHVTGTFGFVAAFKAIEILLEAKIAGPHLPG